MIYTKYIAPQIDPEPKIQVIVTGDLVVVQHGKDRVILPKAIWEAKKRLPHPERVQKHITRVFSTLQEDSSVTNFGLLPSLLSDESSGAIIPRDTFGRLSAPWHDDELTRVKDERTHLLILRAILERSSRRWQFVWMGIKIPASISDQEFFDKMERQDYVFGQGDVLDVTLRIHQSRDAATGIFMNAGYEIVKVHGVTHRPKQISLD